MRKLAWFFNSAKHVAAVLDRRLCRRLGGSVLAGSLLAQTALADEPAPNLAGEETPIQAAEPDIVEPQPKTATTETGLAVATPAVAIPAVAIPAVAAPMAYAVPTVVGDYRVGHVHESHLDHMFHYSLYHPFVDQLRTPGRRVVFGDRRAPYVAGYRAVHVPNYNDVYVPKPVPCDTGYRAGYGPQPAATSTPAAFGYPYSYAPGAAYTGSDAMYSGEPTFYAPFGYNAPPGYSAWPANAPYGRGSASYFGAYRGQ